MKICWDNIQNLYLTRKGNLKDRKTGGVYYENICCECGEWSLLKKNTKYCSLDCLNKRNKKNPPMRNKKHTEEAKKKISDSIKGQNNPFYGKKHTEETRKKISDTIKGKYVKENHPMYGKKHTEETRKKMSEAKKGKCFGNNNGRWKGGYRENNIPAYDTYASQLDWVDECRRNENDLNILEIKCTYCGKWFVPKKNSVHNRIQALKGNYLGEARLYCSSGCKTQCPIYRKTPETLMKEDAVRAGRLNWIELNREVQPELRQIVFKRDEYACIKCKSTDKIHCHHIYPVSIEPIESADVNNCITLCIECHKEVHQKDGCKYGQLSICL